MGVYIWNKLPSEYQEVEWIGGYNDSAGFEEYIDTGVTAGDTIGIHTSMLHTATRDNAEWFYTNPGGNTNRRGLTTYPSGCWCPQRQSWHQTNVGYSINTWYDIKLNYGNNKQTLIDGTNIYSLGSGTITSTVTVKVGNISYSGYGWKCKFIKMTNGTTLVRNMIPCYRKSDSVIGLYDLVNNQFYTNSGTGTFSKGSDVNTYREKEMKNAYIGEYVEETYTLTGVPDGDVNKYISIAKSGNTVKKVVFEYTSNNSSTSTNTWVRISGTNNTANRYGIGFTYNAGNPQIMVNGNINSASPTTFLNLAKSGGIYNVKFTIESGKTTLETTGQNTISQTRTQTTAEKNIVDTVLNSSTINAYASRSGATISDITITVIYEPN